MRVDIKNNVNNTTGSYVFLILKGKVYEPTSQNVSGSVIADDNRQGTIVSAWRKSNGATRNITIYRYRLGTQFRIHYEGQTVTEFSVDGVDYKTFLPNVDGTSVTEKQFSNQLVLTPKYYISLDFGD